MQESVFKMSLEDRQWFIENRLYPNSTIKGKYGCASLMGFLAQGEDLLQCCQKDQNVLKEKKVSYETLASRLLTIIEAAQKEKPNQLIFEKYKVTIGKESFLSQFCPFSPRNADAQVTLERAPQGYFGSVNHYCGNILGDKIITILNVKTNRSIRFSNLLPHLISKHHFFEGSVPFRLNPEDIISVLEIPPDLNTAKSLWPF